MIDLLGLSTYNQTRRNPDQVEEQLAHPRGHAAKDDHRLRVSGKLISTSHSHMPLDKGVPMLVPLYNAFLGRMSMEGCE